MENSSSPRPDRVPGGRLGRRWRNTLDPYGMSIYGSSSAMIRNVANMRFEFGGHLEKKS